MGSLAVMKPKQKAFGHESTVQSGRWVRGHMEANDNETSQERWVYEDSQCKYKPFSHKEFCEKAIGCGKRIMLVGDSTLKATVDLYEYFYQKQKATHLNCPSMNGCSKGISLNHAGARGCVKGPHNEKMHVNIICKEYCAPSNQTVMTYVRHDHLVGIHGSMHFKSSVCEHWWTLAAQQDVIILSAAAHIHELVMFPNEQPAPAGVNSTSLISTSARLIAAKLKQLKLKKDAVIVFVTSSGGIANFSSDCNLKPAASPLPIDDMFSWPLVPRMQSSYVGAFRQALLERGQPFLVLDLQHLQQMRRGCRGDYVHSSSRTKDSPYFNTWLLLFNLLLEHNAVLATS